MCPKSSYPFYTVTISNGSLLLRKTQGWLNPTIYRWLYLKQTVGVTVVYYKTFVGVSILMSWFVERVLLIS